MKQRHWIHNARKEITNLNQLLETQVPKSKQGQQNQNIISKIRISAYWRTSLVDYVEGAVDDMMELESIIGLSEALNIQRIVLLIHRKIVISFRLLNNRVKLCWRICRVRIWGRRKKDGGIPGDLRRRHRRSFSPASPPHCGSRSRSHWLRSLSIFIFGPKS